EPGAHAQLQPRSAGLADTLRWRSPVKQDVKTGNDIHISKMRRKNTSALFTYSRAVNNELLDTYQLKSLDGLVEAHLEDVVISKQEKSSRRSGVKDAEIRAKLYLGLRKYMQNSDERNGSNASREELQVDHIDNFPLRKPYDRVIRCLGFRFNFSIFDRYRSK
ncbi:hypothetical protein XENOCAPTIV_016811, partial [Xenoophorus captivus]